MSEYNMIYAGIGSRDTPSHIQEYMTLIAENLYEDGWTLRSGAARGADKSFEAGAQDRKEIFTVDSYLSEKTYEIAAAIHPAWDRCTPFIQKLLARNVLQVLGQNLDSPVDFVVCWTPDGCESDETRSKRTGGTGQAISLASIQDIPVYNLANEGRLDRVRNYIK